MTNMEKPRAVRLCDGVNLRVISTQSFKSARLGMYFVMPADKKRAPLNTLVRGVLMRGCEKYPSLEKLNIALDELYGTTMTMRNFLDGDRQVVSFNCEMLDSRYAAFEDDGDIDILGGTVDILSQLLLFPILKDGVFREDIVEREKEYLCDTIRDDISDTASYSKEAFRKTMCAGEGYGVSLMGDVEYVSSVTAEEITRQWREMLSDASLEIFYVGSDSAERVEAALRAAFDNTPIFAPRRSERALSVIHRSTGEIKRVSEDKPVSQGKLLLGWSYSGETQLQDYCAAVVFCELLGVMQSSMLFTNIRERLGLCYHIGSSLEPSKWVLSVSCGINPSCRELAEGEILKIFDGIKAGVLSEDLLTLAQSSLENYLRQLPDSAGAMEGFYLARALEGGVYQRQTPGDFLDMIMRVDTDAVIRAARSFTLDTVYFLNATNFDEGEGC